MTATPKTKAPAAKAASSVAPEVRQCQTPEHWLFGSVAVRAGEDRWGVMNPAHGGHWATDDEVADWTKL